MTSSRALDLAVLFGLCSLVLAAPLSALSVDGPLAIVSQGTNRTLPLSITAPLSIPITDPFDLPFPPNVGIQGYTEYYAWRRDPPLGLDATACVARAIVYAKARPQDQPVGLHPRDNPWRVSSGRTHLVLAPEEQMTWKKWAITLLMMQRLMRTPTSVQNAGFQFLVVEDGIEGHIGWGSLTLEEA